MHKLSSKGRIPVALDRWKGYPIVPIVVPLYCSPREGISS
tara:strand:- start:203 stop:322 length:120 start_codon:yes stop_codon:yes gene_type:complete